jgi:hypothetical protein
MPRLTNRLHERFCWLIADGMGHKEAYLKLNPGVSQPGAQGKHLIDRLDVSARIAEIQNEVQSRAIACIDLKRDLLRQMIEGTVPTKVIKKESGKIEAIFDRLAALTIDAKLAGEFAEDRKPTTDDGIKLTFEVYHRNSKPPKDYLEAEIIAPEPVPGDPSMLPALSFDQYRNAPMDKPDLDTLKKQAMDL